MNAPSSTERKQTTARAKRNATQLSSTIDGLKIWMQESEDRTAKRLEAINDTMKTELCLFALHHNIDMQEVMKMKKKLEEL